MTSTTAQTLESRQTQEAGHTHTCVCTCPHAYTHTAQASTDALRRFATLSSGCRRREILTFFGETPPYDRCGTCDLCAAQRAHAGDLTRDFRAEAELLLTAVDALAVGYRPAAYTAIKALALQGKWPTPCPPASFAATAERLQRIRDGLKPERRGEDLIKARTRLPCPLSCPRPLYPSSAGPRPVCASPPFWASTDPASLSDSLPAPSPRPCFPRLPPAPASLAEERKPLACGSRCGPRQKLLASRTEARLEKGALSESDRSFGRSCWRR